MRCPSCGSRQVQIVGPGAAEAGLAIVALLAIGIVLKSFVVILIGSICALAGLAWLLIEHRPTFHLKALRRKQSPLDERRTLLRSLLHDAIVNVDAKTFVALVSRMSSPEIAAVVEGNLESTTNACAKSAAIREHVLRIVDESLPILKDSRLWDSFLVSIWTHAGLTERIREHMMRLIRSDADEDRQRRHEYHVLLGSALRSLSHLNEALDHFRAAARLAPGDPRVAQQISEIVDDLKVRDASQRSGETDDAKASVRDAFGILGLKHNATREELTRAYRSLISQYHPDKVASLGDELKALAHSRTQQLNAAYAICKRQLEMHSPAPTQRGPTSKSSSTLKSVRFFDEIESFNDVLGRRSTFASELKAAVQYDFGTCEVTPQGVLALLDGLRQVLLAEARFDVRLRLEMNLAPDLVRQGVEAILPPSISAVNSATAEELAHWNLVLPVLRRVQSQPHSLIKADLPTIP